MTHGVKSKGLDFDLDLDLDLDLDFAYVGTLWSIAHKFWVNVA